MIELNHYLSVTNYFRLDSSSIGLIRRLLLMLRELMHQLFFLFLQSHFCFVFFYHLKYEIKEFYNFITQYKI